MVEEAEVSIEQRVRSPRSAALAGILFSLLIMASMILLRNSATADAEKIDID